MTKDLGVRSLSVECRGFFIQKEYNNSMDKTLVAKLRKEKGWTQETLAERAYVTVRTVQRLEAGEEVSVDTLKSVSNALSVTVSDLFDYVGTSAKEEQLMELSKKQSIQSSKRKSEYTSVQFLLVGIIFLIMALLAVYIDNLYGELESIMVVFWIFLLFVGIGVGYYLLKVVMTGVLDRRYPLTAGFNHRHLQHENREPIANIWEFLARYFVELFFCDMSFGVLNRRKEPFRL